MTVAALLAIAGGATFCFLTLFATIYQPLHYDNSVNYGEAIQFGDILAGVSGAAAVALGLLLLFRPGNFVARGLGLLIAGAPTLLFTVIWAFSDLSELFSRPFYFGLVYFADFGRIETDSHVIQLLLLIAGAMVVGAGLLALSLGQRVSSARDGSARFS